MLKRLLLLVVLLSVGVGVLSFVNASSGEYSAYSHSKNLQQEDFSNWTVQKALIELGDQKPVHYLEKIDPDSAKIGERLIKYGELEDGSIDRISKYFVCTDCHNIVLETDDPADESPDRVLKYSMKNKVPFLPGSTFYSMYNKEHWYNGDYDKKYGDLVKNTRDTLYNAIQLCATQCSQGRELEFWEIRCIIHYYKTLELKISDLVFTSQELNQLSALNEKNKKDGVKLLKSKYNTYNDAHFGTSKIPVIPDYQPNFESGKYIYEGGCLHCHAYGKGITNFDLGMDKLSFKFLAAKKEKYNSFSISHITRYGTYSISGRKQYMPQYTFENMSDKQMLDLIYFIETKAKE
ncbi:cytochrome c [Paracrocinitomix mangrovi]|uniref:c-type cytochrome n=1 Tax=Paracrocinitomix mangrovi TaxID=2862509 RepID=UPI001C8E96F2|nr:c-type cytochrome [Paracrocinitomix mangrovi]UKN03226.1 cytochrome c [Paracrocinitomix mangrovi]